MMGPWAAPYMLHANDLMPLSPGFVIDVSFTTLTRDFARPTADRCWSGCAWLRKTAETEQKDFVGSRSKCVEHKGAQPLCR